MNKIDFAKYFNCDYPGFETLEEKVLIPIFGKYYMPEAKAEDFLKSKNGYKEAERANIKSVYRRASIIPEGIAAFNVMEIFDITVEDNCKLSRSRVNIQQFIRSKIDVQSNALLVFHYETPTGRSWRFSYFYRGDSLKESTNAKRYTYLFGKKEKVRTAVIRFNKLLETFNEKDNSVTDEDIENVFSVEKLSDEFFDRYLAFYVSFVKFLTNKNDSKENKKSGISSETFRKQLKELDKLNKHDEYDQYHKYFMPKCHYNEEECDKRVRDYVKKMMGRLVFLHFLQRKGWMCNDYDFMYHLYENSNQKEDFLDKVLEPLFFAVLNTHPDKRMTVCKRHNDNPYNKNERVDWDEELIKQWAKIPYLNGGLFEQDSIDKCRSIFPKEFFEKLFDFFNQYNFTIDENDPHDAVVGVDPEMLSKIFENLLEDNKDKGAFYTPKTIVHYMCTESLIAYLKEKCKEQNLEENDIRQFVLEPELYPLMQCTTEEQRKVLLNALKNIRVCDPAIGSGAFPMGMLNCIYACRHELEPETSAFEIKQFIIQNNIFGVDIEQGAVDIARLRFWLALVVEEQLPHALPNLDYRIMKGNSLLTTFMDEYVNIESSDGRSKTFKMKKDLAKMQKEYYNLSGEEKLNKEIEIKMQILNILETQLKLDKVAAQKIYERKEGDFMNINSSAKSTSKKAEEAEMFVRKRQNLLNKISDKKKELSSSKKDLIEKASTDICFFDWKVMFSSVFEEGNGFDLIIGNPPYGANIPNEQKNILKNKFDYLVQRIRNSYLYFIGIAGQLSPKGIICFIVPNELLFQVYMSKARTYLLNNTTLNIVVNVGDAAFDRVVPTCIFLLTHIKPQSEYDIKLVDLRNVTKEQLPTVVPNINYEHIKHRQLLDTPMCTFSFDFIRNQLLTKLVDNNDCLETYCDNIFNGVSTSCNDVYVIPPSLAEENKFEAQYVKPTIKGEHITKYHIPSISPMYLLYIKQDFELVAAPNIARYLTKNKELLIKKCVEKRNGKRPWQILFRARKEKEFMRVPKIIIRQTGDSIIAAKDLIGYYSINSTNIIIVNELYLNDIDYLLAILNSKLIDFYYKEISQEGGRVLAEVKPIRVRNIPIAFAEVEQRERIKTLVNKITSTKIKNANADTSLLEQEIDCLVYKLYDLTYAEVKIVDPNTPITEEEYNK